MFAMKPVMRQFSKALCLSLAAMVMSGGMLAFVSGYALAAPIPVYVDTEPVIFDVYPVVTDNGRVLVGLRGVFEAFGSDVYWNGDLRKITSTNGDIPLEFEVDNTTYWIDGKAYESDTAPQVVGSRVMIPLRLVAECYQAAVHWNGNMQAVFIYSQDYEVKATNAEETETNDKLDTANRIYPGQSIQATFGDYQDIDCFKLWINNSGAYVIEVDGTASGQEPAFTVYDGQEQQIAVSSELSPNIHGVSLDLPVSYCYIQIKNLNERISTTPYKLTVKSGRQ